MSWAQISTIQRDARRVRVFLYVLSTGAVLRPRTKLEISRAFAWVLLSRDTTTCGGEGIVLIGEVGKGGVFFFLRNTQVERICIHPPNQQQWYVFENMNVLLAEVMLLGAGLTCIRDLASLRSAAVTRTSL